ncbi:glycoside hydrolase family 76 protein [Xylariaceae sp. FL0594]|nr:glycoside hydrolase family 76 protein [Xylariaceae sp. FL0594]
MQAIVLCSFFLAWTAFSFNLREPCPVFSSTLTNCDPIAPKSFLFTRVENVTEIASAHAPKNELFLDFLKSLSLTQSEFFAPGLGTWPDAIDWTAAVIATHISAGLRTVSEQLTQLNSKAATVADWKQAANLIDKFFTEMVAYYFGQDTLAIKDEAYDDILWVVLGWLETVKFINTHSSLHYPVTAAGDDSGFVPGLTDGELATVLTLAAQPYLGNTWIPTFSRRARIFWDLAEQGWDTKLCNGGMVWNPRLLPYKNAITNELFISASISMYLHWPGDFPESPFYNRTDKFNPTDPKAETARVPRDATYLKAAIDGYRWLENSNMTNQQGLYVDGYHISGYSDSSSNNTKCDQRDEMVFTYNQGVILTGQRGLWEATGAPSYLEDGHVLIQNVINATGYNLTSDSPFDDLRDVQPGVVPKWYGLGRLGVMEEYCDASATCSQDGQTFKGIFFHHLATFCEPVVTPDRSSALHSDSGSTRIKQFNRPVFEMIKKSHSEACKSYTGWLEHNARAALATRNARGLFGQWWTAGLLVTQGWVSVESHWPTPDTDGIDKVPNATDYRNFGIPPNDSVWSYPAGAVPSSYSSPSDSSPHSAVEQKNHYDYESQAILGKRAREKQWRSGGSKANNNAWKKTADDPNTRGRGRTVESHSGGLALLRAYWEIGRL